MQVVRTGRARAPLNAVLAIVIGLLAAACSRTPPEQALRESFAGLQQAVEERDAGALRGFLADDFIGPDGLDRDGARRMAVLYLMRHDAVGTTTGPLDVRLEGDHARIGFSVVLTGRAATHVLPGSARAWQVVTGWRLVEGEWRVTSADWSPVGG